MAYAVWRESQLDADFRRLYSLLKDHAGRVSWLVLRQRSPDFVEGVALQVLTDIGTFDGQSKFSTWAHGVIRNLCYKERRRQKTRRETVLEAAWNVTTTPELERDVIVAELLSRLEETNQRIVQMRLSGMSLEEIGKALGLSSSAVWQRLERLRKELCQL